MTLAILIVSAPHVDALVFYPPFGVARHDAPERSRQVRFRASRRNEKSPDARSLDREKACRVEVSRLRPRESGAEDASARAGDVFSF
jgi:hypothetical protein